MDKATKAILQEEADLIKAVFGSEVGQRLMERWIKDYIWSMTVNVSNTNEQYFRLGQQSFVVHLISTLTEESNDE